MQTGYLQVNDRSMKVKTNHTNLSLSESITRLIRFLDRGPGSEGAVSASGVEAILSALSAGVLSSSLVVSPSSLFAVKSLW